MKMKNIPEMSTQLVAHRYDSSIVSRPSIRDTKGKSVMDLEVEKLCKRDFLENSREAGRIRIANKLKLVYTGQK